MQHVGCGRGTVMDLDNLFGHTSAPWLCYDSYEYMVSPEGTLYLTVSESSKPRMYNPMQDPEQLVMDAVNVGLSAIHKVPDGELKESVLAFVSKYGFLGFITALPTTADFISYESVYLPKNHFIREESLSTDEYLNYFYPFDKPDFHKKGLESRWNVSDRYGMAIVMTMGDAPQAVAMGFQKEYAERYDWLVDAFTDIAFTFMTSYLYYKDFEDIDEQTRSLYRKGMTAFGGISPTYRIALGEDSPYIVWDFHSLLVMLQMCFSFMLTDRDKNMGMCRHCGKAFTASRKGNEFCSPQCKNRHNVYKNRAKKKGTATDAE